MSWSQLVPPVTKLGLVEDPADISMVTSTIIGYVFGVIQR